MIDQIKNIFKSHYGKEAEFIVKAPGRINLIGEHTDYNAGMILPAAIDKYMYFAFAKNDSHVGNVHALDLDEQVAIKMSDLHKTDSVWINYLTGLLIEFRERGFSLKGFDCVFTSDIPMGAGMSSSAALECGFALGIDYLLQSQLDRWEIINMSQHSNHHFMNIYGGIMDQFSSLFGEKNKCMLMDCSDRSFEYFDLNLSQYSLVLINSNVKHEHTSSGYNDRARECKEIVDLLQMTDPQIKNISAVDSISLKALSQNWSETLQRRSLFVVNENDRVVQFSKAMETNDFLKLGDLIYQSHFGLQHNFEVSCPELDLLVEITQDMQAVLGARMMGGGFGGCTINLLKTDNAQEVTQRIIEEYKDRSGIAAESYFVKLSEGASVMAL